MFKFSAKALLCALSLGVAGLGQAAESAPIVIKFSHVVAEHTPKARVPCCSSNWPKSAWATRYASRSTRTPRCSVMARKWRRCCSATYN